jgi:uncharacterized membrane protein
MPTNRIEAFSDGVFAIVITLLIFNVQVPQHVPSDQLINALAALWPNLLGWLISFVVVGVYWVGHHNAFHHIVHSDRTLLWLNNLFLLCVAFIPFSTGLLGEYITERIALIVYGAALICTGFSLGLVWRYASRHLLAPDTPPGVVHYAHRLILTPPILYAIGIALSFVSEVATLIVYAIIPLLYVLPNPWLQPEED